jgi:hypothetical protein
VSDFFHKNTDHTSYTFILQDSNDGEDIKLDNHSVFSLWYLDYVLAKNYELELIDQDSTKFILIPMKKSAQYRINWSPYFNETQDGIGRTRTRGLSQRKDRTKEEFRDDMYSQSKGIYDGRKDGQMFYQFGTGSCVTMRLPPYEFDILDKNVESEFIGENIETRYPTVPLKTPNFKKVDVSSRQKSASLHRYSISPKYKFPFEFRKMHSKLELDVSQFEIMNKSCSYFGFLNSSDNRFPDITGGKVESKLPNVQFNESKKNMIVYLVWYYGIRHLEIYALPFLWYRMFEAHVKQPMSNSSNLFFYLTDDAK